MVTHSITGTLVGGVSKMTYPIIAILVSISAVSKSCLFLFADSQPCVSWTPECGLLHTFQEHHIQQAQKWSQDSKQAMNIASACKPAQRVIICVSSKFRKWMQGCVQPRSLGCLLFALFSHFKLDRGGSGGGLCGMQLRMRARACTREGGMGVVSGHRISHLEKADAAFFWSSRCVSALSLFPFPARSSLTPPRVVFFFALIPLLYCPKLEESWSRLFELDHGGHRGSRLDSAAPDSPALDSSDQRVRHLQKRHAAYCWSGKK